MKNKVNRALAAKKNKILFVAILFASVFSTHVNAQLEVLTSGDVRMSKYLAINGAAISDSVSIKVMAPGINTAGRGAYGIYSTIKQSHPLFVTSGIGVGVLGRTQPFGGSSSLDTELTRPTSAPFYAGVVGMSSLSVGVYGTTLSSLPPMWMDGNYAGFFEGDVKVSGMIYGTVLDMGDNRHMANVNRLGNRDNPDLISLLNPVSFTLSQESVPANQRDANTTHYGFVAQELQEIAPELVSEDGAGYLYINYMELIPLLVQKVQELSAEVEELKKQNQ